MDRQTVEFMLEKNIRGELGGSLGDMTGRELLEECLRLYRENEALGICQQKAEEANETLICKIESYQVQLARCNDALVLTKALTDSWSDEEKANPAAKTFIEILDNALSGTPEEYHNQNDVEALGSAEDVLRDISNYLYEIMPVGALSPDEADWVYKLNTAKELADNAIGGGEK